MKRPILLFLTAVIITILVLPADLFSQQITDPESEYLRIRSLALGEIMIPLLRQQGGS